MTTSRTVAPERKWCSVCFVEEEGGAVEESMAEGYNHATGQWIGRTSQNRTLNFTHALLPAPNGQTLVGSYLPVRVTRAGPNSLAGEAAI